MSEDLKKIEQELLDWTNRFPKSVPNPIWMSDSVREYILGLTEGEDE